MNAIRLFTGLEVYYLEVGLLEALWKTLKLIPPSKFDRVRIGIKAIRRTYKLLTPPAEAYTRAAEIYHRVHRDYIDALHYSTAEASGVPLLTIDIEFLDRQGYPLEGLVYTPRSLRSLLKSFGSINQE